jgi:hypothetical protein
MAMGSDESRQEDRSKEVTFMLQKQNANATIPHHRTYVAVGIGVGVALGYGIGAALGNAGRGIGLGLALGAFVGSTLARVNREKRP